MSLDPAKSLDPASQLDKATPALRRGSVTVTLGLLLIGMLASGWLIMVALGAAKADLDAGVPLGEVFEKSWLTLIFLVGVLAAGGLWLWGWMVSKRSFGPAALIAMIIGAAAPLVALFLLMRQSQGRA